MKMEEVEWIKSSEGFMVVFAVLKKEMILTSHIMWIKNHF